MKTRILPTGRKLAASLLLSAFTVVTTAAIANFVIAQAETPPDAFAAKKKNLQRKILRPVSGSIQTTPIRGSAVESGANTGDSPAPFGPGDRSRKRPSRDNWELVFSSEFNENQLDESKCEIWDWADTMEGEKNLYYTPDDVYIQNGKLIIRSRKNNDASKYQGRAYTSGKISSKPAFLYGKFEIRAKLPKGKGIHPAFWLSGAKNWPPEIDIFELLGQEPNKLYFTNHFTQGLRRKQDDTQGSYVSPGDFSNDFHLFALEWEHSEIRWYVDGILRFRTNTNIPNEPMILILNTAASSAWAGMPDATTIFPQYYIVDYIRIYKNLSHASLPLQKDEILITLRM